MSIYFGSFQTFYAIKSIDNENNLIVMQLTFQLTSYIISNDD